MEAIEKASGLENDSLSLLRPLWIMGTVLTIIVPDLEAWGTLLGIVSRDVQTSDMIRHKWMTTGEHSIFLEMALNGWAHTRQDRARGSPILSLLNGANADSMNIPQMIRLILVGTVGRDDQVRYSDRHKIFAGYREIERRFATYQLLASFLRLSLRLGPADLGRFLDFETQEQCSKWDPNRLIARGRCLEEQSMLRHVCNALQYARDHGFFKTKHLSKVLKPATLFEFGCQVHVSTADRYLDKSWTVLVKLDGVSAVEALRKRTPSFFMCCPEVPNCKPQVHVVETSVLMNRNCVLLAFRDRPEEEEIQKVLDHLRSALYISPNVTMLATDPFAKGDDDIWIRADGMLDIDFHDRVLCPHLRSAIIRDTKMDPGEVSSIQDVAKRFPADREAQRFVVYARQGREDKMARLTIPRQLSTILLSEFFSGPSPVFREGYDKLLIVEEICSSNQHPVGDRSVFKDVPTDLPRVFFTVSPDRLTSRSEEVELALSRVAGDIWYDIDPRCLFPRT